jgi:hypothetical protein
MHTDNSAVVSAKCRPAPHQKTARFNSNDAKSRSPPGFRCLIVRSPQNNQACDATDNRAAQMSLTLTLTLSLSGRGEERLRNPPTPGKSAAASRRAKLAERSVLGATTERKKSLGAGVTPAEGSVKPTAGFTTIKFFSSRDSEGGHPCHPCRTTVVIPLCHNTHHASLTCSPLRTPPASSAFNQSELIARREIQSRHSSDPIATPIPSLQFLQPLGHTRRKRSRRKKICQPKFPILQVHYRTVFLRFSRNRSRRMPLCPLALPR